MKKLLIFLTFLFALSIPSFGQEGLTTIIRNGASLPTVCKVGDVFMESGAFYINTSTTAGACTWSAAGGGGGGVSSVVIAGTANQIGTAGTCTITSTGTCTLSLLTAQILGTDNSTAGTIQMANGSANAHTIWGSAATTSNTILGFTVVPTTGHLVICTVSGIICTLTDGGTNVATATALASVTGYSVYGSGASAGSWFTPSANGQCLMSGVSSYATTSPSFQSCPGGGGVTSFTGDGALITNSASTGVVTATLGTAGAYKWWGNNTSSTATPSFSYITVLPDSNGLPALLTVGTATAVDYLTATNGATGNPGLATLTAAGSDTNVTLKLVSKGTGIINLNTLAVNATGSTITGAGSVTISATGSNAFSLNSGSGGYESLYPKGCVSGSGGCSPGAGLVWDVVGALRAATYITATNCQSTGGTCGSAAAGMVTIAAAATTVVVATTAVTANSEIMVQRDDSLGTALTVTCDTQSSLVIGTPRVTARTATTNFTISVDVGTTTNPLCLTYHIIN